MRAVNDAQLKRVRKGMRTSRYKGSVLFPVENITEGTDFELAARLAESKLKCDSVTTDTVEKKGQKYLKISSMSS